MATQNYRTRDDKGRAFTFYATDAEHAKRIHLSYFSDARLITAAPETEDEERQREAARTDRNHRYQND